MSEKTIIRLDALAALVNEKAVGKKDVSKPYVGLEHIKSGSSKLSGFAESTESISTNNVFRQGDILFGKLRPQLRKSLRAPFDGYCSTDILVLRPREGRDKVFTAFVFQSDTVFAEAIRTEEGTKMPRCSWATVKDSLVYCPEPVRQKRIGSILSSIDRAIKKTEALIEKYKQIKAGLMHDLFTRGIGPDGKLRPPREQAPELYQETPIGWIPKAWNLESISALAAPFKGAVVIGPFGSDLVMSDYRSEGVPVVFVRDVKEEGFEWISNTYLSREKARNLWVHRVMEGDLVATKMGLPPCIAAKYPSDLPLGIITADIIRMTPNPKKADISWLTAAINHDRVKRQVSAITAGVTRPKVTLADFRFLMIATSELTEQIQISDILQRQNDLLSGEQSKLAKVRSQKAGLMHDLLTGKVQVNPDPPEPADA